MASSIYLGIQTERRMILVDGSYQMINLVQLSTFNECYDPDLRIHLKRCMMVLHSSKIIDNESK